jgi:hypothetical protein
MLISKPLSSYESSNESIFGTVGCDDRGVAAAGRRNADVFAGNRDLGASVGDDRGWGG